MSFALFLFSLGLFACGKPVPADEIVTRGAAGPNDTAVLTLATDLQAKVKVDVAVFAGLLSKGDVNLAEYVAAIATLTADINASTDLFVKLPGADIGVLADAIAQVYADILINIFAQLDACTKVIGFVGACGNLDVAIAALFAELNVCVSGVLVIIAKLCVSIKVCFNVDLAVFVKVFAILSPLWASLGLCPTWQTLG